MTIGKIESTVYPTPPQRECCEKCTGVVRDENNYGRDYGCLKDDCPCHKPQEESKGREAFCGHKSYEECMAMERGKPPEELWKEEFNTRYKKKEFGESDGQGYGPDREAIEAFISKVKEEIKKAERQRILGEINYWKAEGETEEEKVGFSKALDKVAIFLSKSIQS